MKKQKNIPVLRFSEFKGEWQSKTLGDISNIRTGPFGSVLHQSDYATQGTPIITVEHLGEQGVEHLNLPLVSDEDKRRLSSYLLKTGDVVFSRVGSVDRNALVKEAENGWLFSGRLLRIRFFDGYDSSFMSNYFHREETKNKIRSVAVGQTMPSLNTEILKGIPVVFPFKEEQQKIASFLTALDDKLQALKKKKALLEQYKKGVMQKIFSQQLRFKDDNGKAFPEWEEYKLKELGETFGGLSGKTKEDFGNGFPYIQYMQIFTNSKIDIKECGLVSIKNGESQNKVQFGDIFFTISSETPEEIGISSVLLNKTDSMYLNSFCFGFRPYSLKTLSPYFARYLFRSVFFRKDIVKLAQGSTRFNMSKVQLLKLEISLPPLEEQAKIANFLSAIDDKITHCNSQIEKTEQYKKGLLQKMFV